MHRDIKPENLLITSKGRLVIADFGHACECLPSEEKPPFVIERPQTVGSFEYNAPELSSQPEVETTSPGDYYDGSKADVFSAGVTLFLMLTRSPPFRGAQLKDPYYRRLCAHDKKAYWKIFGSLELSDSAKDLFERMAERDPQARLSISEVLAHPWVQAEMCPMLDNEQVLAELTRRSEALQGEPKGRKSLEQLSEDE